MISNMGYLRVEMKDLCIDRMIEVLIEILKGNLLAWKIERMKGELMVKLIGIKKVTLWGLITGNRWSN